MATVAEIFLALVVTDPVWKWKYGGAYAVATVFLLGMVWVMADKKKEP